MQSLTRSIVVAMSLTIAACHALRAQEPAGHLLGSEPRAPETDTMRQYHVLARRPAEMPRPEFRPGTPQRQMDDEGHDSLWNGTLYGALAGIPAVLLLAGGGTGPDKQDVPGMIVYGALLGGVIGFMVDAAW